MKTDYNMIIIGGGLVGLTTALACAHKGLSALIIERGDLSLTTQPNFDGRASAIANASFNLFKHVGLADALAPHAQPINDILITDGEVGRTPSPLSIHFKRSDHDGPSGFMIENGRIRSALISAVRDNPKITVKTQVDVTSIETLSSHVKIALSNGDAFTAAVTIAADGRHSATRRKGGISVIQYPYEQKAIVTTIAHEKPHLGVAHELFFPGGPFAILPLTENRANIVWSDNSRAVDAAMALPDAAFQGELARRFGDFLGQIEVIAPRHAYPLSLQMAEDYISDRLALVGDAAHTIHPIAGQGFNLGVRDAAALADVLSEAKQAGLDIGGVGTLENYKRWRQFDNESLAMTTDMLNGIFSTRFAPLQHGRRLGMALINRIKPARQAFVREAAGEFGDRPSLMRG